MVLDIEGLLSQATTQFQYPQAAEADYEWHTEILCVLCLYGCQLKFRCVCLCSKRELDCVARLTVTCLSKPFNIKVKTVNLRNNVTNRNKATLYAGLLNCYY